MTVTHVSGATLKLVAGFDPRLREFFLSVRDARLSDPDETPVQLSASAQTALEVGQAEYVDYESLCEVQPLRSIGDVEAVLQENGVPFGDDEDNPEGLNPQLLRLLVTIMNEKENGGSQVGRTLRNWDVEAAIAAQDEEEAEFEQGVLRAEQRAEWAAEARANAEADAAAEAEEEFEDEDEQQEQQQAAVEAGPIRPLGIWSLTKAQIEKWWAKHVTAGGIN